MSDLSSGIPGIGLHNPGLESTTVENILRICVTLLGSRRKDFASQYCLGIWSENPGPELEAQFAFLPWNDLVKSFCDCDQPHSKVGVLGTRTQGLFKTAELEL